MAGQFRAIVNGHVTNRAERAIPDPYQMIPQIIPGKDWERSRDSYDGSDCGSLLEHAKPGAVRFASLVGIKMVPDGPRPRVGTLRAPPLWLAASDECGRLRIELNLSRYNSETTTSQLVVESEGCKRWGEPRILDPRWNHSSGDGFHCKK